MGALRPPMHDTVTIYNPTGEKNRNDEPEYNQPLESIARVQQKNNVVTWADGSRYETTLEIDLPGDLEIGYETEIEYTDRFNRTTRNLVRGLDETTNFAGNRVYYWTVQVE